MSFFLKIFAFLKRNGVNQGMSQSIGMESINYYVSQGFSTPLDTMVQALFRGKFSSLVPRFLDRFVKLAEGKGSELLRTYTAAYTSYGTIHYLIEPTLGLVAHE